MSTKKKSVASLLLPLKYQSTITRILFRRIGTVVLALTILGLSQGQAQTEAIKQPSSVESRSEGQSKQQMQRPATQAKGEVKEASSVSQVGPLTEEEQKAFEKSAGPGWQGPGVFKTQEEAIKYLKILVKGDEKTIRWFQEADMRARKNLYDSHLAIALSAIDTGRSREAFNLAVEVLKNKRDYPKALGGAARAVGKGLKDPGDEQVIRLLREFSTYPDSTVRLFVGEALVKAGDSNTGLQILDDVTKEGTTAALGFIFETMDGKKWEGEGVESIKKALTYENKESNALAALFLIQLTNKGRLKEDLGKIENMLLEMFESILNKQKWDEPIQGKGYSDGRTVGIIIIAFQTLKSRNAIPLLKRLLTHPQRSYLGRRAEEAIRQIESSGGRK
jgi:hypothetical protein